MDKDLIASFHAMTTRHLDAAERSIATARRSLASITGTTIPKGAGRCSTCGAATLNSSWNCPLHEDPNGGDGADD